MPVSSSCKPKPCAVQLFKIGTPAPHVVTEKEARVTCHVVQAPCPSIWETTHRCVKRSSTHPSSPGLGCPPLSGSRVRTHARKRRYTGEGTTWAHRKARGWTLRDPGRSPREGRKSGSAQRGGRGGRSSDRRGSAISILPPAPPPVPQAAPPPLIPPHHTTHLPCTTEQNIFQKLNIFQKYDIFQKYNIFQK